MVHLAFNVMYVIPGGTIDKTSEGGGILLALCNNTSCIESAVLAEILCVYRRKQRPRESSISVFFHCCMQESLLLTHERNDFDDEI